MPSGQTGFFAPSGECIQYGCALRLYKGPEIQDGQYGACREAGNCIRPNAAGPTKAGMVFKTGPDTLKKERMLLLSALNERGEMIMLTERFTRLNLQQLKTSHTFYCRDCREPLILKIGSHVTPHFSHYRHSTCATFSEPESPMHLQGKKDLFLWLRGQGLDVSLEQYFPSIRQRADLVVRKYRQLFAIEYQCSPIPFGRLMERTAGYRRLGILPVWILGGMPFRSPGKEAERVYRCSDFQLSFLRHTRHHFYLFSYAPGKRKVCLLSHMMPVSAKTFRACYAEKPLSAFSFPFTDDQFSLVSAPVPLPEWFAERRRWIGLKIQFGKAFQDPFLRHVYEAGMHPVSLPPFIGLPLLHMAACKQHPVEWQFYVWLDALFALRTNAAVSLDELLRLFTVRMEKKEIEFRKSPYVRERNAAKAMIYEYAQLLVQLGLWSKGKAGYHMNKNVFAPKNTEELEHMERHLSSALRADVSNGKAEQ